MGFWLHYTTTFGREDATSESFDVALRFLEYDVSDFAILDTC